MIFQLPKENELWKKFLTWNWTPTAKLPVNCLVTTFDTLLNFWYNKSRSFLRMSIPDLSSGICCDMGWSLHKIWRIQNSGKNTLSAYRQLIRATQDLAMRIWIQVLGGLLSPLEGRGPEVLKLDKLRKRIESLNIQEVIVALDSTLEGDATALYLKDALPTITSRLAFGLPMGSPLDYVDPGTLSRALTGRRLQD